MIIKNITREIEAKVLKTNKQTIATSSRYANTVQDNILKIDQFEEIA